MVLNDNGLPVGASILADINQFVRGNPLLSTAILGASLTGITAGVIKVKRRKVRVSKRRKRKAPIKRRRKIKRKGITHRSPRHKGHKRVSFTTKEGKRVNFLVKQPKHKHKRRR